MNTPADSWPQPPVPAHLLRRRRHWSSSLLTLPVVFALLTIPVAVVLFFAFPRVLWKSSAGVKRVWDSLNVALVLFAVLCGIFAPRRGDEEAAAEEARGVGGNAARSSPKVEKKAIEMSAQQWFQSIDRRIYELPEETVAVAGIGRLGRNGGTSLLDPMQESRSGTGEGRFQCVDDFAVDGYYRRLDRPAHVPLRRWQSAIDESEIKEIQVDTFVRGSSQSPPSKVLPEQAKPKPPPNPPPEQAKSKPPPNPKPEQAKSKPPPSPPAPPPPPTATQKKRPAYDCDAVGATATPQPPRPPPRREQSPDRIERRKSSATAELKVIIASVLSANKRKKRKPKARTIEESNSVRPGADKMPDQTIPPPPPPPPPQPQSFLSIFKRTSKTRRIHSASAQPPHQPPSPPDHHRRSTTKPPLPKKPKNNHEGGNTMHPPAGTPAAPPPSSQSSFSPNRRRRSQESGIAGSDGEASGSPPTGKKSGTSSSDDDGTKARGHVDGEDASKGGPGLFCESPDVNMKADTFIARLKDGWRMERMNSIREKHGLGLGIGPDPL